MKNFESVNGGKAGDLIAGNAAANTLDGFGGNDFLYGGLGVDSLTGGTGSDTFVYLATKESGLTRTTRDTIFGFEGAGAPGGDKIDLEAIDADTTKVGNDAFSLIDPNLAFTAAGQLRTVIQDGNTILQGDVNGDGKADFSIAVVGTQAFDIDDFVL